MEDKLIKLINFLNKFETSFFFINENGRNINCHIILISKLGILIFLIKINASTYTIKT